MNHALDAHLNDVGILASCLTHTLRGEPSSALIPSFTPRPHVHDIVLFGWPEGSFSPSRFCSSHVCTQPLVGKGLIHIKGGHPL